MNREAARTYVAKTPITPYGILGEQRKYLNVLFNERILPVYNISIIASSDPLVTTTTTANIYSNLAESTFWNGSVVYVNYFDPGDLRFILQSVQQIPNYDVTIRNLLLKDHGANIGMFGINIFHLGGWLLDFLKDTLDPDCTITIDSCGPGQHLAPELVDAFGFNVSAPMHDMTLYPWIEQKIFLEQNGKIMHNPRAYKLLEHQEYRNMQLWTKENALHNLKQKPTLYKPSQILDNEYFFQHSTLNN